MIPVDLVAFVVHVVLAYPSLCSIKSFSGVIDRNSGKEGRQPLLCQPAFEALLPAKSQVGIDSLGLGRDLHLVRHKQHAQLGAQRSEHPRQARDLARELEKDGLVARRPELDRDASRLLVAEPLQGILHGRAQEIVQIAPVAKRAYESLLEPSEPPDCPLVDIAIHLLPDRTCNIVQIHHIDRQIQIELAGPPDHFLGIQPCADAERQIPVFQ
jgi:hypothetical protein